MLNNVHVLLQCILKVKDGRYSVFCTKTKSNRKVSIKTVYFVFVLVCLLNNRVALGQWCLPKTVTRGLYCRKYVDHAFNYGNFVCTALLYLSNQFM